MVEHIIGFLISAVAGLWIWYDAQKRGKTSWCALLWGTGGFVFLVFFLPLWIIIRPDLPEKEQKKEQEH